MTVENCVSKFISLDPKGVDSFISATLKTKI